MGEQLPLKQKHILIIKGEFRGVWLDWLKVSTNPSQKNHDSLGEWTTGIYS